MKTKEDVGKIIEKTFQRLYAAERDFFENNFGLPELRAVRREWAARKEWPYEWPYFNISGSSQALEIEDSLGHFHIKARGYQLAQDLDAAAKFFAAFDGYPAFLADRAARRKQLDRIHEAAERWLDGNPWPIPEAEADADEADGTARLGALDVGEVFELATDTLNRREPQCLILRGNRFAVNQLSNANSRGLVECVSHNSSKYLFTPDTSVRLV